MYAIQVNNGEYTYLLGMYLGNVKKDEPINPFRDYHPSLVRSFVFDKEEDAKSLTLLLNKLNNTNKFTVLQTNKEDFPHMVRYHW